MDTNTDALLKLAQHYAAQLAELHPEPLTISDDLKARADSVLNRLLAHIEQEQSKTTQDEIGKGKQ